MYFKDLTNRQFGLLTVLKHCGSDKNNQAVWLCKCQCGNEIRAVGHNLIRGSTKSCGCLKNKLSRERLLAHGKSQTRLYEIWGAIKSRCYCESHSSYKNYGGRGISMCVQWRNNFQVFYEWAMSNGYSDDLTIDRIDVNGAYCPENCRWISHYQQQRNRRNNVWVEYKGEKMILADLSKLVGIPQNILGCRLRMGWDIERAVSQPIAYKKKNKP